MDRQVDPKRTFHCVYRFSHDVEDFVLHAVYTNKVDAERYVTLHTVPGMSCPLVNVEQTLDLLVETMVRPRLGVLYDLLVRYGRVLRGIDRSHRKTANKTVIAELMHIPH
jgi:hypothetical protein